MAAHPSVTAPRQASIDRAVALIDANLTDNVASPQLTAWLAQTDIHDHLKADPTALRDSLAAAAPDDTMRHFGAWKAAQQLLHTAGLPY